MISESGNWNVADSFSKSKIMRPLNLCDYYEDVALFGYEALVDELASWEAPPNDLIKYKAIRRLVKTLIRVIDNSKFALKRGNTRKEALSYKQQLLKIEEIIPALFRVLSDETTGTSSIAIVNLTSYDQVINQISKIKSKINEPLNKNHLIFTDKEEFDPVAYKKSLKKRMTDQG